MVGVLFILSLVIIYDNIVDFCELIYNLYLIRDLRCGFKLLLFVIIFFYFFRNEYFNN